MLVAAIAGFATAVAHRQRLARLSAPARSPARCWRAAFGVLVIWLNTNQYATGPRAEPVRRRLLGLRRHPLHAGEARRAARPSQVPGLGDLPFVGPALFRQHPMVYFADRADGRRSPGSSTARAPAWCCARSASRPSRRTRSAIRCGASGCSPSSSAARCAALAGAYLSVVYTPLWVEGMIAGQGLDRARAHDLRHLAAGARAARRLPVRRRDDAAVSPAGRGRADRRASS